MNIQGNGWHAAAVAACAAAADIAVSFTEATQLAVTLPTGTTVEFGDAVQFFAGKQQPAENAAVVSRLLRNFCFIGKVDCHGLCTCCLAFAADRKLGDGKYDCC